jgi:hypothetical protein
MVFPFGLLTWLVPSGWMGPVVLHAHADQVLDRGRADVALDHRDGHRAARDRAGRVAVQPRPAVPGTHRPGGPAGGPPGPVLPGPLVLQHRPTSDIFVAGIQEYSILFPII